MLNQLLKFTLMSSLLLWLKPRWRSLLALIVLIALVHILHGEYLGYVELSGDRSFLVWSYVVKWLVLTAGVLIYLYVAVSRLGGKGKSGKVNPEQVGISGSSARTSVPAAGDGFDFLREKKQLQSRPEKLLSRGSPGEEN